MRSGKDLVTANVQPLDVPLARLALRAIAKGVPAVARVGHLPNILGALDPLDAQRVGWLTALTQGLDQFSTATWKARRRSRGIRANSRAKPGDNS